MIATTTLPSCSEGNIEEPNNGGNTTPETPSDIIANNGVGEDGYIKMNDSFGGIYFGQFWRKTEGELWANYYLMLTNDEVGVTSSGNPAPMHQGGWVLFLDIWGEASANHTNPILPEGTYSLGKDRNWNRMLNDYTLATNTYERVWDEASEKYLYRIKDVLFTSGTLTVEHTSKGYLIEAEYTTTTGESVKFRFEGDIAFEDKSDDEDFSVALDEDVDFKPVQGWTYRSSRKENCDKHIIYLFDVPSLTDDYLHSALVGGKKLQLTIYTEIDGSLAGTYVAGEQKENGFTLVEEKAGLYYPGCYAATMAVGSFVECVASNEDVLFSLLTDGTITITENSADGTHTIVVDGLNEKGKKITCNWTGVLGGNPNAE